MVSNIYTPNAIKTIAALAILYYFFGNLIFLIAKYTFMYLLAYVFISTLAEASNPKKTTNFALFFSLV